MVLKLLFQTQESDIDNMRLAGNFVYTLQAIGSQQLPCQRRFCTSIFMFVFLLQSQESGTKCFHLQGPRWAKDLGRSHFHFKLKYGEV